ncbi:MULTISPECIES: IS481 family transposase [unclassified Crossiella]|uniref:IS481 family transposase n=1 Tax=unclassified Crossiella TaxID=2620835 RepID=UPI002000181C|nr:MULTISPECIES: IS481 family transposase [unclassified Crossiella]MCK2238971.1 IS481 family transposase [Crossiella sp. S99.2]MCK2251460.1 IS481 family transposase [Crossiella sp. S99.1]
MTHANAPLSELGRLRLARCVIDDGWPLRRAAERFQVSVSTAQRWAGRYRELGVAGMADRSSRPLSSPRRTSTRTERRIIKLRLARRWGPARIAYLLRLVPSTVHRVLTRYGLARLRHVDRATGQPVRRYERATPGELVHVDIKKLGNIPDGGGHKIHGRGTGKRNSSAHRDPTRPRKISSRANLGYSYLHNAVDDHSRLAYTEILADETKETATGFWQRAQTFFHANGIIVERVLTDNGSCYRSRLWRDTLAEAGITHKRTRPYRPQTNGKVERFNRTLREEWAYARPYRTETQRREAFPQWLHLYNHHRGHTALKGLPPASRIPNLSGQYS